MRPIVGVNEDLLERYPFRVFTSDGGPEIASQLGPPCCRKPFRLTLLPAVSNHYLAVTHVDPRYHVALNELAGSAAGEIVASPVRAKGGKPGVGG